MRRLMTAFALIAASLLLLQPVCSAYELSIGAPQTALPALGNDAVDAGDAGHSTHDGVPCCSELKTTALAGPSGTFHAQTKSMTAAPGALSPAVLFNARLRSSAPAAWATPPPPALSYYARSARILR